MLGTGQSIHQANWNKWGGLRALTGVWKMFIQHGADIITNDEAVREDFVRKTLGVGWDENQACSSCNRLGRGYK
jgi:hypothetical protein